MLEYKEEFGVDDSSLIAYKGSKASLLNVLTGKQNYDKTDFHDCENEIQVDNRFRTLLFS